MALSKPSKISVLLFFILTSVTFSFAQPNDDPCNATPLTVSTSCTFSTFTNAGATASVAVPAPGCANYQGGDVWFSVVVPAGGTVTIDANTGVITDGGMAVYTGTCNALILATCDDDTSPNGLMPLITYSGAPGSTIFIRFWAFGGNNNGTFDLCAWEVVPTCSDGILNQGETNIDCGGPCAPCPAPTVQDCAGSIAVCQNTYSATVSYSGSGNYPTEINPTSSCLGGAGEVNNVWYTFTTQSAGNVCFSITPNNLADDYDWAVYDLTNNPCSDIATNPSLEVSCNFSGASGVTGANGNAGGQNESCIPVIAGQTLTLSVQNWSASTNGYGLDFGVPGSTAAIFDTTGSTIQSVVSPIPCNTNSLTFNFSENVLCSSVQPNDINLSGPGGPYVVNSITGASCALGGTQDITYTLTVTPALNIIGAYTMCVNDTVIDLCGNITTSGCLNFNLNIAGSSSTLDSTICNGDSFVINGTTYSGTNLTGIEIFPISGTCDSVVTITVTELPLLTETLDSTICFGDSFVLNGTTYDGTNNSGTEVLTSFNGCDSTVTITVTELPISTGTVDSTLCFGNSFIINGTTYNGTNLSGTEILTSVNGCDSTVTVTVTELAENTTLLSYPICFGDSIIINSITYNGLNNNGTQILTAANGCDSIVTINILESPLITGLYPPIICFGDSFILNGTTYNGGNLNGTEILTAFNGCDSVLTVSVTEEPFLSVEIGIPDTISCEFSSVMLYSAATSGNSSIYTWSTTDGNIIPTNFDSIIEVSSIGHYTVEITNNFGCTADSTIVVYENFTTPVTTDLVITLCDDIPGLPLEVTIDLTSYDAQVVNNDSLSKVEWFYDGVLTNPIATPTNFTTSLVTYFILATNPWSGCTNTAKVNFKINHTPIVAFTSDTVCEGFMTSFANHTVSIEPITNTFWEFGDGSYSYLNSPEYIYPEPGIHSVSLTITNDKQCTESFTADVEVFANPIANFSMNPNPATMLNSTVNFTNQSTLFAVVDSFKWDFGGINSSILKNPTYSFSIDTTGNHIINLEVIDQNGCKNSKDQILSVFGNAAFYMPTAFTPDGDGLNDVFITNGFGILDEGFSFLIFDRWGTLVFESHSKDSGWDGTFNGKNLPTGTYVWKLTFLNYERIVRSETGHVNVVK